MSRIDEVARLRLRGLTQQQIADELHVTKHTVRTHVSRIRKAWKSKRLVNLDEQIVTEVARLNHLEATYWRSWEASQAEDEYPNGDPRYLDGVLRCISRRIKLLGLENAKIDVSAMIRRYAEAAGMDPDEALVEARRVIEDLHELDLTSDTDEPQAWSPDGRNGHPRWSSGWTEEEYRELARLIAEQGSVTSGAHAYSESHPWRTAHAAISQYYLKDRLSAFTAEANGSVDGQA